MFNEIDFDGCLDIGDDTDDDGDGISDSADDCPLQAVNNVSDDDGDGCIDVIAEPSKPFIEKFMEGDPLTMGIVLIPLLALFAAGMVIYVKQGRADAMRRLREMIDAAEKPIQLSKVSR